MLTQMTARTLAPKNPGDAVAFATNECHVVINGDLPDTWDVPTVNLTCCRQWAIGN